MALQVKTATKQLPPHVVYFGTGGLGKTTIGADFPSPVFVATENGISGITDIPYIDLFTREAGKDMTMEQINGILADLITEDHKFKTVVIDTIDGIADLYCKAVCNEVYGGRMETERGGGDAFMSFHKGYKVTADRFRRFLNGLDVLRDKRGVQSVLISHSDLHTVKNSMGEDYGKTAPNIQKDIWNLVFNWSDVVGYVHKQVRVIEGKGKSGKAKTSKMSYMTLNPDYAVDTKVRAGYGNPDTPDSFEFSYANMDKFLNLRGSEKGKK